jgi:hypothetical protein
MFRTISFSAVVVILSLVAGGQAQFAAASQNPANVDRVTSEEFKKLMRTIAEGWNEGNAKKAADCYSADAIYSAPPGSKNRKGREVLFEFFGGDKGREAPMNMNWHDLAFDEESQIGFGEYTFRYKDYQAHGIVAARVRHRKIGNWREYEVPSKLSWQPFVGANNF